MILEQLNVPCPLLCQPFFSLIAAFGVESRSVAVYIFLVSETKSKQ